MDDEELKNLSILKEEEGEQLDLTNLNHFDQLLFNITTNYTNNQQKKKIRPPESLKSPLAPIWIEPVETWRALVTEDVLSDAALATNNNSIKDSSKNRFSDNLNALSQSLASLNIFSGLTTTATKSKTRISEEDEVSGEHDEDCCYDLDDNNSLDGDKLTHSHLSSSNKVSVGLKVAKSRLTTPVYMKSGPGYDDFGYVSTQELIKVS